MSTFTSGTYTAVTDKGGGSFVFGKYFSVAGSVAVLMGGRFTDPQGHAQEGYEAYWGFTPDYRLSDLSSFNAFTVPRLGHYFSVGSKLTHRGLPSSDSIAAITSGGYKGDYLVTLNAHDNSVVKDQVLVSEQQGHVHFMEFSQNTEFLSTGQVGVSDLPYFTVTSNGALQSHMDAIYSALYIGAEFLGMSYSAQGQPQNLTLYGGPNNGSFSRLELTAPVIHPLVSHGVGMAFSYASSPTVLLWTSSGNAKTVTDLGVVINPASQFKHGVYLSDGQHTLVQQADTFVVGAGDNTFRLASHSATVIAEGGNNHVLIRSAPGSHDVLVFNQSSTSSAAGSSASAGSVATIDIVAPAKAGVSFHAAQDLGGHPETILHIGHAEVDLMGISAKSAADLSALGITLNVHR